MLMFEGRINYNNFVSGILKKYNRKIDPSSYQNKLIYIENSINSILDYFPYVKGILMKEGGVLSHVAIVSREFKMPNIIGIDFNIWFDDEMYIDMQEGKILIALNNYIIPTDNYGGLFHKSEDFYLIYNKNLKISLNTNSFELISDFRNLNLGELYAKYGNNCDELIRKLILDDIFKFAIKTLDFRIYKSLKHSPDILDLQITDVCNMCCKTCYADISNTGSVLSLQKIKEVIDSAHNLGFVFVSITGGEPTLHPDFNNIISYIKNKGFYIHLNINGSNVTKEIIDTLHLVDGFGVSFDAFDEQVFTQIRGINLKDKVYSNLRLLIDAKLDFNIVIVVNRINIDVLESTIERLKEIGIKKIKLNYFLPIGRGAKNKELYLPYSEYVSKYKELEKKNKDKIEIMLDSLIFCFRDDLNKDISEISESTNLSCGAYRKRIAIKSNGDVIGCLLLSTGKKIGDVYKENLEKIISNIPSKYVETNKDKFKTTYCDLCKHKSCCGLGCLAFYDSQKGILDPRCIEVEKRWK